MALTLKIGPKVIYFLTNFNIAAIIGVTSKRMIIGVTSKFIMFLKIGECISGVPTTRRSRAEGTRKMSLLIPQLQ
jgi:hypothetical protein